MIPKPAHRYNYMAYPEIVRTTDPSRLFKLSLHDILEQVCKYMHEDAEELKSRNRKRDLVNARQLYYYFAKKYTRKSLNTIGGLLGYDHATVIHGVKNVSNLIQTDKDMQKWTDELHIIFVNYTTK